MGKSIFNLKNAVKVVKAIEKKTQTNKSSAAWNVQRNQKAPAMPTPPATASNPTVSSAPAQNRTLKKERFIVAGTPYHKTAIQSLAKANPDWRKGGKTLASEGKVMVKIPHYTYVDRPVKLVFEPTNQYDRNAIKVMIAGEHVGYIKEDENIHVGNILRSCDIKYITAEFRGGEYKFVSEDGTVAKWDNYVGITLHMGYV